MKLTESFVAEIAQVGYLFVGYRIETNQILLIAWLASAADSDNKHRNENKMKMRKKNYRQSSLWLLICPQ